MNEERQKIINQVPQEEIMKAALEEIIKKRNLENQQFQQLMERISPTIVVSPFRQRKRKKMIFSTIFQNFSSLELESKKRTKISSSKTI